MGKHLWIAAIVGCFFSRGVAGQPALLPNDVVRAETCAGSEPAASASVEPSSDIVIAVLGDTLREDDMAGFRKDIVSFYESNQRTKTTNSIRLALLLGDNAQFAGPFRTRALLQSALGELAPSTAEPAEAPQPLRFYSVLAAAAPKLGSDWTTVVLVGRFPAVSPELAAFTTAWLSMRLRAARLRVGYWTPSGEDSEFMDAVASSTGGMRLPDGLAGLAPVLPQKEELHEVSWSAPVIRWGFRVCPISLMGSDGQAVARIPSVAVAAGVTIPELERYALLREKTRSLAAALALPQLSAGQALRAEADLDQALEVSPREEETLRLGVDLYKRLADDRKLVSLLSTLGEMAPGEERLFADLGHARYRLADWDGAESALLRSRELKPGNADVAEELARIRLGRHDDRGALPFLEESLAARGGRQDLWLLRADMATRLEDWQRIADSVEHALALGSVALDRRTGLIRLYLAHQLPDRALVHVRAVAGQLPADAAVRSEYAGFLDTLQQPEEALAAWKRTLEANAGLELAHVRIARLLIGKKALPDALEAAEAGIEAAPKSVPLYLAKAEVLEKLDRFYDARRTLRRAVAGLPDPSLLLRLAEMEDAGGEQAARYYRQAIEGGDNAGMADAVRSQALRSGLAAALRDGDMENAAWFRAQLTGGAAAPRAPAATVPVPGGLDALSFMAHSKRSPPERFMVEYARTVARRLDSPDKKVVEAYAGTIHDHFRRIAELAALGTAKDGKITVTIAAQDKKSQKNAEKVLDLLGWKMHAGSKGVKLEAAEKGARASHQETASALAIDEVGMQQDLEQGKVFSFDIPLDTASVVLGEELWRSEFYPKEKWSGGLAEVMAGDLHLAQIYAALGQMDATTAAALVSAVGLKTLAEKHAPLLLQYSSALALEQGRVAVPGGTAAEAIWSGIAGASPRQPGPFFHALLTKDDGKLLAYYGRLGALDMAHQRFFTRTAARTAKFYELFKDAPEMQRANSNYIPSGSFAEFLNDLPLDGESVDFPGSPEVWMVAKGQSHSSGNISKMLKKVKRTAAPEVEDEILLRLAKTRYSDSLGQHSELDNFLAAVRVDAHRSDPLEEASALLLAQHFAQDGAAYPFFATLTGLGQKQFEQFFALTESVRARPDAEKGAALAPIYSLIEILCLAQRTGALNEARSAEIFSHEIAEFQGAASVAARTAASLDLVREILAASGKASADPDQAMRDLLLGSGSPVDVDLDGAPVTVDPSKIRHAAYRQVMELQKVPALATVLAVADAARNLAAGKDPPAPHIQVLQSRAAGLFYVDAPKELKLTSRERELVEGFQPRRLQEIVKQLEEKTGKKKVNPKDLEKLSQDYLQEIDAPVRWALEGIVYAYFLSPEDLLVAEDPLLLRKHQFVVISPFRKTVIWQAAELEQSSEKAGSYFTGGFADFGDAAGAAAAQSAKLGGDNAEYVASKQMAALRVTDWTGLRNEDLRLLGLKVTVAREWMVRAAEKPELQAALAEDTLGLLSLNRRADLLGALAAGNWTSVWSLATLSDLYFLGDRYLDRYPNDPWQSPAVSALRQLAPGNDGSRLQILGGELNAMFGCSHPHLRSAPPYEEYEKELLGLRLAERSSEFKLYLAKYADVAGVPAAALGALAEPAARAILKRLALSDIHDWRSVSAAYAALDEKVVEGVLAK
jgi:Tfp pilus assembly protein PilF